MLHAVAAMWGGIVPVGERRVHQVEPGHHATVDERGIGHVDRALDESLRGLDAADTARREAQRLAQLARVAR